MVVSKKKDVQKQKQKKAKQQQQQQQKQNVKINISLGDKPSRRRRRKSTSVRKSQPQQQLQQFPTPQYVPMFITQQPATYFTPPVPTTTLPVTPPTTTTAPINISPIISPAISIPTGSSSDPKRNWAAPTITPIAPTTKFKPPKAKVPTIKPIKAISPNAIELNTFDNFTPNQNIISNLIGFGDLDEPRMNSFVDYGNSFADVDDWVQESMNEFDNSFYATIAPPKKIKPPKARIPISPNTTELNSFVDYGNSFADVDEWVQESMSEFDNSFDTTFSNKNIQTDRSVSTDYGTQMEQPSSRDFGIQMEQPSSRDFGIQMEQPSSRDFGIQMEQPSFSDFGTQTKPIPSAVSATLREMETQTDNRPPPPKGPPPTRAQPPPPTRAQPPPPIPREFTAPTQDIQASGIQKFVSLTPESLAMLGEIRTRKGRDYAESEAPSEMTEMTSATGMTSDTGVTDRTTNIFGDIRERAKKIETGRQQTIDEIMKKRDETKGSGPEAVGGMMGQMAREMEKRRQFIEPASTEEEDENNEWNDDFFETSFSKIPVKPVKPVKPVQVKIEPSEIIKPKMKVKFDVEDEEDEEEIDAEFSFPRKKIEPSEIIKPKMKVKFDVEDEDEEDMKESGITRKPGSGRPKGVGNKSAIEKQHEADIKEQKKIIREYKKNIKDLIKTKLEMDEKDNTIEDYKELIEEAKDRIEYYLDEIDIEREKRILQPVAEEDEIELNDF